MDGDEKSHVPTADTVLRIFHPVQGADGPGEEEEQLEEIDFTDIGRLQAEVDAAATRRQTAGAACCHRDRLSPIMIACVTYGSRGHDQIRFCESAISQIESRVFASDLLLFLLSRETA